MPAIRFNSVDLPEPEGPIRQRKDPDSMVQCRVFKRDDLRGFLLKNFLDVIDNDSGHELPDSPLLKAETPS
jgi:hypothetical protein